MKTCVTKRKITAWLLAIFMTLSLLPIAVSAASATGYAKVTVGSADIVVSLSDSSRFSESEAVENTANWTLVASGSQTIISVTRVSETSARVTLSSQAEKLQTFTLNALDAVFAEGTEPFATPISVAVATPAAGTAEGTAGDSNILVTLSSGIFGANASVQKINNWALGGTSAESNPIVSVTYVMGDSRTTATLTLTNPIAAGDVYTVTASQSVFGNAATAPFASPLEVAIANNDGGDETYACQIGEIPYLTLDEALDKVATGDTITLLQSITHTSPVEIVGKSITFALGSFDLTIDTSATDGSTALHVSDSGVVNYTGSGSFSVIGDICGVRAKNGSIANVTSATVMGESTTCVLANGPGASTINVQGNVRCAAAGCTGVWAYDGSKITVSGKVTCEGDNSVGVKSANTGSLVTVQGGVTANANGVSSTGINANNGGEARITGDVIASERGVTTYGSPNPGVVTINGNIIVTGLATESGAERKGISAGGGTTVTVNGNVSVAGENCTGIYANGSTVTVTGNVTSANTGVVATGGSGLNGTVTIDGVLTAVTTYIKVGTTPKTAADDNKSSDREDYLQYTDGTHNVYIKNVSAATYLLTVMSGTGGGSYAAGMPVNITANPPTQGEVFDKWITSGGGSFGNANSASTFFAMPDKAVTVTAIYKDLPPESYAVNVQNDGNGTASASTISATAGTEVTLTGTPGSGYRFKEWQVVSGDVTVINNKFTMPAATVTVKAIFELIPAETPEYKITKGSNQSWTKGTASGVEITCDGNLSNFSGIKVDGVLIEAANYTASSSTVITLKSAYLETLSVGHHTVEIVYNDGKVKVQTRLSVLAKEGATPTAPEESGKVPQMGDNGNLALLFGLLFISGGAILGISLHDKKRRSIRGRSR